MRFTDLARPIPNGSCRSWTKEGFLRCADVPIARTGSQAYGPGETPIAGDYVTIDRDDDEVFHPEAISSIWGKPVVIDHPSDAWGGRVDVTPDNWRRLAVGVATNPRQSDTEPDLLVADLTIYDTDAIDAINRGKKQISCGYDADYESIGPNRGRQHNIRINHIALVDQGRCGFRCSIGDSAFQVCSTGSSTPNIILHSPVTIAGMRDLAALLTGGE
jgi:hypothetical protein